VQRIIKVLRQCRADPRCLLEIGLCGTQDTLQAAELPQQRTALGRAQPGHSLEDRLVEASGATPPVTRDRETVCLVPQALQQLEGGRSCAGDDRRLGAGRGTPQMELFIPRSAIWTLGDAQHREIAETEWRQHFRDPAHLRRTTVDDQQVGRWNLAGLDARVPSSHRLS
jgi:hypothetical protein